MKILSFETSCDDTSIALFEDENLIYMDTMSQISIHNKTWWVVPEIAAREHANAIFIVLENVLEKTHTKIEEIDYIWVTVTPWLIPSLLTWITVANTIWNMLKIPVIEINHIEAHIFSNFLERKEEEIKFPLVCLTVSWWHNEIYYMSDMWSFEKIWWTTDDSAWECFDKVAKMMWLSYPGWPIISQLASEYETTTLIALNWDEKITKSEALFPRVRLEKDWFEFSFSGLKSSVKREIDKRINLYQSPLIRGVSVRTGGLTELDKQEISYEFENSVVEVLAYKLINAWKKKWVTTVMLAWWVSANDKLKDVISKKAKENNFTFIHPVKKVYSMDNWAMVGINTYYKVKYWFIKK